MRSSTGKTWPLSTRSLTLWNSTRREKWILKRCLYLQYQPNHLNIFNFTSIFFLKVRKVVSTDPEARTSTGKRAALAARLQRIEGGFQFLLPSTFPCQHSNKALSKLGSLEWTEFLPSVKLWMKSSRTGDEFLNLVSRYLVLCWTLACLKKIDLSLNLRLRVPLGKTMLHAKYQNCQRNAHAKD